jgi:hypothetical protein
LAENCDASLKARRKFALEVVHEVGETPRLKKKTEIISKIPKHLNNQH